MIRMFFRWFRSLYFALFFVAVVLSVCTWFFAPFIGGEEWRPFDSVTSRIVTISAIFVFFLTVMAFPSRFTWQTNE